MFDDPSATMTAYVDDGRYIAKLVRLEPTDHAQYGPGVRWVFHLATPETMSLVVDVDGQPYELWQTTSTKMGKNVRSGKVARARTWSEALLDREIADSETGADIGESVVGRKAVVLIGKNEAGYPRILQMDPYSALSRPKTPVAVVSVDETF